MSKTILIAEDDRAISQMLQLLLEQEGYRVETQADGHMVAQMREPFPDLLLLDIRMSGTDGRAICRHLKDQAATRHVPIILISAAITTTREQAREAGADDFLEKPFAIEEVLSLVARYAAHTEPSG
ncbi:MAG TPA: response regulator transcription factor [Ktedonobacteraceae bacterium]